MAADIIITSVILAIVALIIVNQIKKKGHCSCGCSDCAASDMCHKGK